MLNSKYLNRLKKLDSFFYAGAVLGVLMLIFHFPLKPTNDDFFFMAQSREFNLFPWLWMRYSGWSSRIVIEATQWIVAKNFLIWKLLNITFILLLYYFLSKIFIIKRSNKKMYWIVMLAIVCYPLFHLGTAGYMTTSIVYLWSLVFAVIALYGMKKSLVGNKIHAWEYPVYVLSLLFAGNLEAMNIILLGISALMVVYSFINNRINYYLISQLVVVFLMLVFILSHSGNAVRQAHEIATWYPDFEAYGLLERIQLGYTSSLAHFMATPNVVFFGFAIILYLVVRLKYSRTLLRIIAAVPLVGYVLSLLVNLGFSYNPDLYYWISSVFRISSGVVLITADNFTQILYYIPLFVYSICFLCVLIAIYLCFKKDRFKAIFYVSLIGLGFLSRAIMGFSPTIWASSYRTFIFFYFSFIICIIVLFQELIEYKPKREGLLFGVLITFSAISYVGSLALREFFVIG